MNKETKSMFFAGLAGQAILFTIVVAQNRVMKKNNAEAKKAIDSADELRGLMSNGIDSVATILGRDDLDYEEKIMEMHNEFSFINTIVHDKLESWKK